MKKTMRGQATTELALSSLVLVSLMALGIYFGEVTFGSLKVTEAATSALWDMTYYKSHTMTNALYSTNSEVGNAANQAATLTRRDYQDFDGRTRVNTRSNVVKHVMTQTSGMTVECSPGGAPGFNPNILGALMYTSNNGATCRASADFMTHYLPTSFSNDASGFFKEKLFARASPLRMCGSGKDKGANCPGKFAIMLDDWGLTGPAGGEWNTCKGLPLGFGVPCTENLSYWWTIFKGYMTSYAINMALNPTLLSMPASEMAQWVAFANPMGGFAGLIGMPLSGNESTFYMSFTGAAAQFQQAVWSREGFKLWETTPYLLSLMFPYSTAFRQRAANGGCYLGKPC